MALSNEILLKVYRDMVRSRALDDLLIEGVLRAKLVPSWHSGRGQEGICGVISLLREDDYASYTHRGCYVWVAKGMDMGEIVAEFYGKRTGCSRGKGGTHIAGLKHGVFGRSGMQGGHPPLMGGAAIAAQLRGKGQVAVCCFGDACSTRGTVHESLNHSAIWKLPVLWLCENNGFGMSTRIDRTWAQPDVAKLAGAYDMPGVTLDGNDAIAVAEAADVALARARAGEGPTLLELKTYRLRGHHEGDTEASGYRTRAEIEPWLKKDPIDRMRAALLNRGVLTGEQDVEIRRAAAAEARAAEKFADESPAPSPEEAYEDVYAI